MPRKVPFSGKKKKQQLQEKRDKNASSFDQLESKLKSNLSSKRAAFKAESSHRAKASTKGKYNPDRYNLNFLRETRDEIDKRKLESQTIPIKFVSEHELEVDIEEVYQPGSVLDMPKRPKWKYGMSKGELEAKEEIYFNDYLEKIHKSFGSDNLSYFEHNLETWRQAWRVIEMCDIITLVTDVRHPVLHFSPALYEYVVEELKKPLILVLNKIDLVPANVISAWTSYFRRLFPLLHVIWFTSFPQDSRTVDHSTKLKTRRKPKKRVYATQIGPKELLQTCREICGDKVDLSSWEEKIENDLQTLGCAGRDSPPIPTPNSGDAAIEERRSESDIEPREGFLLDELTLEDGVLTVGFVGHPNVGKSSLMNGLIGRKVVSTSVTPGHTKYFQTYYLTKTVKLCDSPGLVFPSLIPKQLQILSGIYPVAQVQEPYTPVGFLAARIPLVELLRIHYPTDGLDQPYENYWTPWDVCEAWANKKHYRTAKAARPDVYRAANAILRMAVDGRLCLYMRPPGYTDSQEFWTRHEDTLKLLALQSNARKQSSAGEGRAVPKPFLPGGIIDLGPAGDLLHGSLSDDDFIDTDSERSENPDSSNESDNVDLSTIENPGTSNMYNKFAVLSCLDND